MSAPGSLDTDRRTICKGNGWETVRGKEGIAEIHADGFLLASLLDIVHYCSTAPLAGVTRVRVVRYAQVLLSAVPVLLVLLHTLCLCLC